MKDRESRPTLEVKTIKMKRKRTFSCPVCNFVMTPNKRWLCAALRHLSWRCRHSRGSRGGVSSLALESHAVRTQRYHLRMWFYTWDLHTRLGPFTCATSSVFFCAIAPRKPLEMSTCQQHLKYQPERDSAAMSVSLNSGWSRSL